VYTIACDANTTASTSINTVSKTTGAPDLNVLGVWEIVGILFMAFGLVLASVGGVGGGPIIVPVLVLIIGFDIKRATPVSNVIIIGGAIANAIFNFQKRHPLADRPLIDPDLSLVMIPPIIGGAVIGAFFAKLLPPYIISICLAVILIMSGTRSVQKGIHLHKAEVARKKKGLDQERSSHREDAPTDSVTFTEVRTPTFNAQEISIQVNNSETYDDKNTQKLTQLLEEERFFSWKKHGIVFVCYLGIVVASVSSAFVKCGSAAYWSLLIGELPWVLLFMFFSGKFLNRIHKVKIDLGYPFVQGDIKWNFRSVAFYPALCSGAGIIAGMLGVGGGIVMGPLLIEIGVIPQVASATSAWLVFYASASATAKFSVFNMIAWNWAASLGALSFLVTLLSQKFILAYVRKTGRESIIVLCIGATILLGAGLMSYQAIRATMESVGKPFDINVCPKAH
jgi:uncharacterized membrane protein YfcA